VVAMESTRFMALIIPGSHNIYTQNQRLYSASWSRESRANRNGLLSFKCLGKRLGSGGLFVEDRAASRPRLVHPQPGGREPRL
jgi:hypothetical protein